jgi:hypothetical protein
MAWPFFAVLSLIWSALRAPYGTTTYADPATDGRTAARICYALPKCREVPMTKITGMNNTTSQQGMTTYQKKHKKPSMKIAIR